MPGLCREIGDALIPVQSETGAGAEDGVDENAGPGGVVIFFIRNVVMPPLICRIAFLDGLVDFPGAIGVTGRQGGVGEERIELPEDACGIGIVL